MQSRSGRRALLLGGPLLALALTTCVPAGTPELTATDPPRTAHGPAEARVSAVDPPRRELDGARRVPPVEARIGGRVDAERDDAAVSVASTAPDELPAAPAPAPVAPAPPANPGPATATASVPAPPAPTAEPTRVVVPRIGVSNPLVPVGLHPDRTLVVPDEAHVAGWYTGAPRPGRTGPSVLVGHNSWRGSRGVFWDLHRLTPGEVVEVHHDDGSVVRFAVERVEQHPKDAFPTQHVYGNTPRQEIRIITCGGVFDRKQRRHLDNIVVFGVLTG